MSARPRPGNWLPMSEATTNLIVRQTFLDRSREKPAEMRLECVDPGRGPLPLDPGRFPDRLMAALKYMKGNFEVSGNWTRMFQTAPNSFYPVDQSVYLNSRRRSDDLLCHAGLFWQLGPDDALIVEVPKRLECEFWNFQVQQLLVEVVGFNQAQRRHGTRRPPRSMPKDAPGSWWLTGIPGRPTGCRRWGTTADR